MKIRRFGGLNGAEIGLVIALGIIGGIYIWKPIFNKHTASEQKNVWTERKLEKP